MGRPEKPLGSAASPIVSFARDLRELRAAAGNPSYRELARTALFAPSVLSSAASGYRLPTLQVTLAFVRACGGDGVEWERRWRTLRDRTDQGPSGPGAMTRAAATVPLTVSPAQLPIGPRYFVGRTGELAAGRSTSSPSADGRSPLVISGPVGAGKTAFALRLTHDLAADFPDGQLYADMGVGGPVGASPFDVIAGFLAALGIPPAAIPTPNLQRAGLLRSVLAQSRVIVLLDDVRDEDQVRPLLARSTHSQILITSRARLLGLDSVRHVDLGAFTRDESLKLIRGLVGDQPTRSEREAQVRLAELCDDLPLALTIAARKIAAQPGRSVFRITRQLTAGTNLLQWLRVGDVSLSDALMSAYARLSPSAMSVFHQLACCGPEGATARHLAPSMAVAVESTEYALEELVDRGLVRPASLGRYAMSPLVALFVQDRLDSRRGAGRFVQLSAGHDAIATITGPTRAGDRWGKGA